MTQESNKTPSAKLRLNRRTLVTAAVAAGVPLIQSTNATAADQGLKRRDVPMSDVKLTYLGGPTYLIEIGNIRLVTDPGFDPQGTERVEGPGHVLTKVMAPPIPVNEIGPVDVVLLSHAQHLDNLDNEGKRLLGRAALTLTTPDSAKMGLPGKTVGLETWKSFEFQRPNGQSIRITAMPAVHTSNPDLRGAVGEVTGFMIEWAEQKNGAFYVSGDTVWIDGFREIARRYKVRSGILHLGAANVPAVGENFLTMTSSDGAKLVKLFNMTSAYPAHFEGWRHFSQGSWQIAREFEREGVSSNLRLLRPGQSAQVDMG
mgnify:CR=1 FL=1